MAISSPGIGSNLDINAIVTGLMKAEQGPLTLVNQQKSNFQSKVSAYGSLKGVLSKFQTTLSQLSTLSKFNSQKAETSDASVLTATANGSAVEGQFSVKVNQLAQPEKISMQGSSNLYQTIGTGKLTISLGSFDTVDNAFTNHPDQAPVTIEITAANNTLPGIRDAINAANAGVTASVVNDGANYHLVLTAKNTGSQHSLKITADDDDGNNLDTGGLSQLAYDPSLGSGSGKNLKQLQAAKDALIEIDGVAVTSSTNSVSNAVEGLTLNLFKAVPATAFSLNVTRDQAAIEKSVNDFVNAFNDANQVIRDLTKYDAATKTGGALLGDAVTRSVSMQLKQVITSKVSASAAFQSLSDIGVTFQRDGKLALDSSKLKLAIQQSPADVPALFAATAKASDAAIGYVGNTDKTASGQYAVQVTQLATQGTLTGSAAPDLMVAAGMNDTLTLNINSLPYTVTLTPGSYASPEVFASAFQSKLSELGAPVRVSLAAGQLQLRALDYGADASVRLTGGNAQASWFGAAPQTLLGLDAAGTINGVVATGIGQQLVGATGDASEGLMIRVQAGVLGDRGIVQFNQGYAYQLNKLVNGLLSSDGLLTSRTDGMNSSISRLSKQQEALQNRLAQIEKRYRQQFTALDTLIGSMQQTSSYLTQQIAQFSSNQS